MAIEIQQPTIMRQKELQQQYKEGYRQVLQITVMKIDNPTTHMF